MLNWLSYFFRPWNQFRIEALKKRWRQLPDSLKQGDQALGRYVVGCGATHGIHERCNFGCTACYLGSSANQQPPLPFEKVRRQLEDLKDYLGPGGNVQITSGEVTLLPVEELIRIVRTAVALELSPMVMTHGDVFLNDQSYLNRLVSESGLRKVSIHIDLTQRGRKGMSLPQSEAALNAVRDRAAACLIRCRKDTGVKLKAAMTLTVNHQNLSQLKDVVPWVLGHLDTFRILSLQPQAKTGRTKSEGVGAEEVWRVLEDILGRSINPTAFAFGHQACNRIALFLAIETGGKQILLEGVRENSVMDRCLVDDFMSYFSGVNLNDRSKSEVTWRILGVLFRKPLWLLRIFKYSLIRTWQERQYIPAVLGAMFQWKLRVRPLALVVHAFMNSDELDTPIGQERLEACSFKVPINGVMTSMCKVNGTELRQSTYAEAFEEVKI